MPVLEADCNYMAVDTETVLALMEVEYMVKLAHCVAAGIADMGLVVVALCIPLTT
jgi:hypothetical protein